MKEAAYQRWICDACGYIYDEEKGDPADGLPPGTRYQDIPDDWQCPLCGMMKSDLRLLPEVQPVAKKINRQRTASTTKKLSRGGSEYVVIVGAGMAGWSAAEAIRKRDPERPILLLSACKGQVYTKPAISLAISQGRSADDLVESDAASRAEELNIEVRPETRVLKVDSERKRLTTAKGGIEYGKLILALGAHQRELKIEGDAADKVLRVNDLLSFKRLQQRLQENVKSVTILGAGLIGSEFADDLTRAGYQVCVVDPGHHAIASLLPDSMATKLQDRLTSKGVIWNFGVSVKRIDNYEANLKLELSDGSAFFTDLVLSAAGLVTNTELAKKTGLDVDSGVAVDSDMKTSNSDIYAIGDCASLDGQLYSYVEPIRRQAEAIAASLTGEHESFLPLPPMVKIKTQSMPMSVCKPSGRIRDEAWQMISNDQSGSHFEILDASNMIGFALSDSLVSEAGSYHRRLTS